MLKDYNSVKAYDEIHELEKLYQFLDGAHHACEDETISSTFLLACHKIQEIINAINLKESPLASDICSRA